VDNVLAVTAGQWVIIGFAVAIAGAGFLLFAVNILSILRPRMLTERGKREPRPLIGKPRPVSRRAFFRRILLGGFGASMTFFGLSSLAFLWPNLRGGFGGKVALGDKADDIKSQIRQTKLPYYYAPGRFYLVEYDESLPGAKLYKELGVVAGGLMTLYQRCVHLGCRVPFCQTSQWFECPCHGSKYNRAGEYKLGPAPRSLDRFPIEVANGIVTVDTGNIVTGPPRGTNTTGQEREGPFCVEQVRRE
jgi:cytochrome b6-f complex iron-sulfur subunit